MGDEPNIVLLVMDTARAKNFSTYGYERETDPNFKRMSEEGILFERAYANSIWTLPSHASIFTGLLPSHHGVIDKDERNIEDETFLEDLSEKGYKTFGISSNAFVSPMYGFDRLFDEFHFIGEEQGVRKEILIEDDPIFEEIFRREKNDEWSSTKEKYGYFLRETARNLSLRSTINGAYFLLTRKILPTERNIFHHGDGAKKANQKFLEEISDEPFFGFINYVEPHDPYTPPEEVAREFLPEEVSFEEARKISSESDLVEMLGKQHKEKEILEDLYDAEIKYLDQQIGKLVENIREETNRETVFIITSDHGENFEDGLWGHYGKITKNLIHVPLLILGAEEDNIKENFSLRNIEVLVRNLSEGRLSVETTDKVIKGYWGLNSHCWNISQDKEKIFYENQKSLIKENLELWSESFEPGSEDIKDYIQLRCGKP